MRLAVLGFEKEGAATGLRQDQEVGRLRRDKAPGGAGVQKTMDEDAVMRHTLTAVLIHALF